VWAWKHATVFCNGVAENPPTHFVVIKRKKRSQKMTDPEFSSAVSKLFVALKCRVRDGFEYLIVNEWSGTIRHAHALLIAPGGIRRRAIREAVILHPALNDPFAVVRIGISGASASTESPDGLVPDCIDR
jgi:hypothetical protein